MYENLNNLDLATCSEAELKAFIRAVSPIVIKFLQVAERLFLEEQKQSSCDSCEKYGSCNEPCKDLEKKLPTAFGGDSILSNTFEDLDEFYTDNSEEMFEAYHSCWHIFTKKQQSVIYHKYKQGLTNNEICKITGSKPSSVSDLLKRAEKRLQEHYKPKM